MCDDVIEKLRTVFRSVFPILENASDEEIDQASKDWTPDWDSMAQLSLLTALEQEFNIQIPDMIALSINSFHRAREFIVYGDNGG